MPPIEQFIRTVKMMEEQQYLTGDPFDDEEEPIIPSQSDSTITAAFDTTLSESTEVNPSDDNTDVISSSDSFNETTSSYTIEANPSDDNTDVISMSDSLDEKTSSYTIEANPSDGNTDVISSSDSLDETTSSYTIETISPSEVHHTVVPTKENTLPTPSVDDSYQSSSSEIIFTEDGFTDKEGNENKVSNNEDDILLIKSDQKELTLITSNSDKSNLFISPQSEDSVITIKMQEGQSEFKGEIGLHANSKNPQINLPKSSAPLNLFNNEDSKISFTTDQAAESVPISLQKLTISDGSIHIDVPAGTNGVEFKEVETFSNGKIETYQNNQLTETSIDSLKLNQGSNIEVLNASFNNLITCNGKSKMKIEKRAKLCDQSTIKLTDSSFINFGKSLVDGICKEIIIVESNQNELKKLDNSDEKSASVMCGSNFDCSAWKEKYSKNPSSYPYAKCTGENGGNDDEKCLVVTNKSEDEPKKSKGLKKSAIIGIVIGCVVAVILIIIIVVAVKKCNRKNNEYP